jgi:hypothetical protein
MKNKINVLKALVATLLLTFGFSKASAKIEPAVASNHTVVSKGELMPCEACIPCIDGINLS